MDEEKYRERLVRDVAAWQRAEIISEAQGQAILSRQGAGDPALVRAVRMGWVVSAASIIGALVLAAGVVLLFASNWEEMGDTPRVSLIVAGLLIAYGAAYLFTYRLDLEPVGSAMLLLGTLLYQAALFLVAQIYNMPVESPVLFLLGAAGALPLAYLFGSRIILLLAIIAIATWQIASAGMRYEDGAAESWAILLYTGTLGLLLYAVGRTHFVRDSLRRFGEVYMLAGALIALGVVYTASFDELWDEVSYSGVESFAAPAGVYWLIGVAAAAIAAQAVLRHRNTEQLLEVAFQGGLLTLSAVVATWPDWSGYALLFNAAFFAAGAAIVARGYASTDERYVNLGLGVVGIGLASRYIDTFWSLLAGSAFFIVGGVLLLALALGIERIRRELLRSMRPDAGDAPAARAVEVAP